MTFDTRLIEQKKKKKITLITYLDTGTYITLLSDINGGASLQSHDIGELIAIYS